MAETRFEKWLGSLNHASSTGGMRQRGQCIRHVGMRRLRISEEGDASLSRLLGAKGLKELDREYMAELWKCNGQQR